MLYDFPANVQTVLGEHFRGMYLSGPLALGDFSPDSSDIDFVVVTDADLLDDILPSLRAILNTPISMPAVRCGQLRWKQPIFCGMPCVATTRFAHAIRTSNGVRVRCSTWTISIPRGSSSTTSCASMG